MTHKKQRTLAQTIMSESYSVSAELDVDLRIMCRRLASRLKLIMAGTECQPASGSPRCPPDPLGKMGPEVQILSPRPIVFNYLQQRREHKTDPRGLHQ